VNVDTEANALKNKSLAGGAASGGGAERGSGGGGDNGFVSGASSIGSYSCGAEANEAIEGPNILGYAGGNTTGERYAFSLHNSAFPPSNDGNHPNIPLYPQTFPLFVPTAKISQTASTTASTSPGSLTPNGSLSQETSPMPPTRNLSGQGSTLPPPHVSVDSGAQQHSMNSIPGGIYVNNPPQFSGIGGIIGGVGDMSLGCAQQQQQHLMHGLWRQESWTNLNNDSNGGGDSGHMTNMNMPPGVYGQRNVVQPQHQAYQQQQMQQQRHYEEERYRLREEQLRQQRLMEQQYQQQQQFEQQQFEQQQFEQQQFEQQQRLQLHYLLQSAQQQGNEWRGGPSLDSSNVSNDQSASDLSGFLGDNPRSGAARREGRD
jgi:hypothetical protein